MRGFRVTILAVAVLVLGACPTKDPGAGGAQTVPDPTPPDFAAGPALEDPPPPDAAAFGHEYLLEVAPRLQGRWQGFLENCRTRLPAEHPFNDTALVTSLELEIDADGALADVRVGDSSGNDDFDRVALEVVRDAGRFTRPSPALTSDDGRVHLSWRFARDRRQAGPAGGAITRVEWELERAVPMLIERGRLDEAARRVQHAAAAGNAGDEGVALLDAVAEAAVQRALADDDVAMQRAALEAAVAARLTASAPRMRELATSAVELDLRRLAAAGLAAVADAPSVDLLAEIIATSGDDEHRGAAARALHALGEGERAWQATRPGLSADDDATRLSALVVLAYFPASAAVPELARAIERPGNRGVRLAAAAALGAAVEGAGHKAGKPLLACLEQRDAALRAACAQALADAARAGYQSRVAFWATAKLLGDADDRVRAAAAVASALLGKASFAKELYRLRNESTPLVLAGLAEGLGYVPGEAALARLLGLAEHRDAAIRRAVARSLARREEAAARVLLASWGDADDLELRLTAIGSIEDPDRLRALAGDDHAAVSAAALARLAAVAGRDAALEHAARLLAVAPSPAHRVVVAGGWLAGR